MSYLFLSYAKVDRETALAMRDLLQYEGLTVWMDENESELSPKHWETIEEIIRDAGVFVLLVSDAAKKSAWVKRELDFAESIQKPIFPIQVQGEAWSRLKVETAKLGLGSNLDLPNDFMARMQEQMQNVPSKALPIQIFLFPTELKQHNKNYRVYGWVALIVVLIGIAAMRPTLMQMLRTGTVDISRAQTIEANQTRVVDAQVMTEVILVSREAEGIARTETRAYNLQATSYAEYIGATETRQARSERVTETAIFRATQARISTSSARTEIAMLSAPTQTAQYSLNQTAMAANHFLPCDVVVPRVDEEINLSVYRSPSNSNNPFTINPSGTGGYPLIVTEWISNESGVWLKVGTDAHAFIGYVRPEAVDFDRDCSE